jgi:Zn-dependent peptidase ImmA (M78 family)
MTYYNLNEARSVLGSLRRLIPERNTRFSEALQVAELQANKLLELTSVIDGPVPSEVISELPRIRVEYRHMPTSGMSYWDGQDWVICLNRLEPVTRQRFTLFHEYKHIIDHGSTGRLYRGTYRQTADRQAEQAADFFAGCALMPKSFLKRAWAQLVQRPEALGARFDVSARAASVRLAQVGLSEPIARCETGTRSNRPRPGTYYRQRSVDWPRPLLLEVS